MNHIEKKPLQPEAPEPSESPVNQVDVFSPQYLSFPGAFKDTVLMPPLEKPPGFEDLTREDVYEACKVYTPAEKFGWVYGASEFHDYIKALKLKLAEQDPSGALVAQLEEQLIELHEMVIEAEYREDEGTFKIPEIVKLTLGYKEENTEEEDALTVAEDPGSTELVVQEDSQQGPKTLAVGSEDLPDSTELVTSAKDLIRLNYVLGFLRRFGGGQVHHYAKHELAELGRQFNAATEQLSFPEDQKQQAELELLKQSKNTRVISVLDKIEELEQACSKVTKRCREISATYPRFGPLMVLTLTEGRVFGEPEEPGTASAADSETLAKSTLLTVSKDGVGFSMLYYDQQWGRLSGSTTSSVALASDLRFATSDKLYNLNYHAQIVNMCPTLGLTDFQPALEQLSGVEFSDYMGDRESWFGEVVRRNKPWLAPESDNLEERTEILRRVTEYLKGEISGAGDPGLAEAMSSLSSVFSSSIFMNHHADKFLHHIVCESVRTGVPLESLKLGEVENTTALEYVKLLWDEEGVITLGFVFEEHEGGLLGLTDFGVHYLIELVDPSNPYFEKGHDNTVLQELQMHKSNAPLLFCPAKAMKKMTDFNSKSQKPLLAD